MRIRVVVSTALSVGLTVNGALLAASDEQPKRSVEAIQQVDGSVVGIPKGRTILMTKDPAGYPSGYIFENRDGRVRIAWTPTAGHPTCSKGRMRNGVFTGKTGTDYPSGLTVRREHIGVIASKKRWTLTNPDSGQSGSIRALSRNGKDHSNFRRQMNNLLDSYCPPILARM